MLLDNLRLRYGGYHGRDTFMIKSNCQEMASKNEETDVLAKMTWHEVLENIVRITKASRC